MFLEPAQHADVRKASCAAAAEGKADVFPRLAGSVDGDTAEQEDRERKPQQ